MRQKDWNGAVQFFRRELNVDVAGEYERLKDVARIPVEKLTDPYFISVNLNNASKNAHMAFLMFLKARREVDMFELEYLRETREFTRLAMARITTWMEGAKLVRKQITASMIQEEIVAAPDTGVRYRELMEKRQELHDIRDAMQQFANLWSDRRSSLQTQAQLARSKRELVLDVK